MACAQCGGQLSGRQSRWCSEACRRAHSRANDPVAAFYARLTSFRRRRPLKRPARA